MEGLVDELIAHGARVNRIDEREMSALGAACENGHVRCAELLLCAAADVNGADKGGRTYFTPLMSACEAGRADCVRLLINADADLDAVTPGAAEGEA